MGRRSRRRRRRGFFRRSGPLLMFCLAALVVSVGLIFGVKTLVTKYNTGGLSFGSFGFASKAKTEVKQETIQEATDEEGNKYLIYVDAEGENAVSAWKTVDGKTYYFDENGKAVSGFQTIDDKLYRFSPRTNALVNPKKGKKSVSHYLCYFKEDGEIYRRIDKNKPMVALTYDDGPSPNTATILDVLEENHAVATFFVVGSRLEDYPDTVKRQVELGNEIGNHTWEHKYLSQLSKKGMKSQIRKTIKKLEEMTGYTSKITRPPGGFVNDDVKENVGQPLIMWNVDTLDWQTRNAKKTVNAVFNDLDDGDIILMHDLYETTAEATKTIVPRLIKKGFQLVTVSEMAECRNGISAGDVVYSIKPN